MPTFRRSLPGAGDPVVRGWSPLRGSSLERRVPKTPRSGAKAPAGCACPKKNLPPKKVIPKSQAKTRPKPATKPRKPTTSPAPRQPANKQVAKRPAVRTFSFPFGSLNQTFCFRIVLAVSLASKLPPSVLRPSVSPRSYPSRPAGRRANRALVRCVVGEHQLRRFSTCALRLVTQCVYFILSLSL